MSGRTNMQANGSLISLELPRQAVGLMSEKFPEGVMVLLCPPGDLQPEFIRLPEEGGSCPVTGLKRTRMIELLREAKGKIKAHWLRKHGGARSGVVLISRRSLVEFIEQLDPPEWISTEKNEENSQ